MNTASRAVGWKVDLRGACAMNSDVATADAIAFLADPFAFYRVLTRFVLKYTLTAQPEPSGADEL